jgi:hypothetical protein
MIKIQNYYLIKFGERIYTFEGILRTNLNLTQQKRDSNFKLDQQINQLNNNQIKFQLNLF